MDLASELLKLDWSYTHADGKHFINNNQAFENCSTFKLIKGTFFDPLRKTVYIEAKEKKVKTKSKQKTIKSSEEKSQKVGVAKGLFLDKNKTFPKLPVFPQRSLLTKEEHILGLRVLCSYLQNGSTLYSHLPHFNVSQADINKFQNKLLSKINSERFEFSNHVKEMWLTKNCSRHLSMNSDHEKFVNEIWKDEISKIYKYPQHYITGTMIPVVNQFEEPVELDQIKLLKLNVNQGAQLQIPDFKKNRKFYLPTNYNVIKSRHITRSEENEFPVSSDSTCEEFAMQNVANIVISPSSLQCIVNNIPPFTKTWDIPLTIKEYRLKDSKNKPIVHTVVYIDNPLPPRKLTKKDKNEWAFNVILKDALIGNCTNKPNISVLDKKCEFCTSQNTNVDIMEEDNMTVCGISSNESDDKVTDDKVTDDKVTDDNVTDDTVTDDRVTDNEVTDDKVTNNKVSDDEDTDDEDKLVMDVDETLYTPPSGMVTRSRATQNKLPTPVLKLPTPVLKSPTPVLKSSTPVLKSPTPVLKSPTPVFKSPISVVETKKTVKGADQKANRKRQSSNSMCTCTDIKKLKEDINIQDSPLCENDFTYNLWKLHQSSEVNVLSKTSKKEVIILVRSKVDGYNENEPCVVRPKVEYQGEFGHESTTASEAAEQWTSLQFNPDSRLIRGHNSYPLQFPIVHLITARMNTGNPYVDLIEKFNIKSFTNEVNKQTSWTPNKSKCLLFNVFSELSRIKPGQYLLSHEEKHGPFVVVYTKSVKKDNAALNLEEAYNINSSEVDLKQTAPWTPIDCLLPTQLHIKHNFMPCMFHPTARISQPVTKGKVPNKMTNKTKKKKNKRKKTN